MKSKAIVFERPFDVKIEDIDLPDILPGQVLTKTALSGVSTGTETRVLSGNQEGAEFPLIPGYENMGVITEKGDDVDLNIGDRVFVGKSESTGHFNKLWGGHLEYAIADEKNIFRIPDTVSDEEAIFTKIGAISLHGVKRAKVREGEIVVVVGLGVIGSLAALSSKAFGATVIGVDSQEERLKNISSIIDHCINPGNENLRDKVFELSNGGADIVFDATGIPGLADSSAQLLKGKDWDDLYHPSGRFVLLGSYTDPVSFHYNNSLFMNEIDILASRDTVKEDLTDMIELISKKKVDPTLIPQKLFKYRDADLAYKKLINERTMRMAIDWRDG